MDDIEELTKRFKDYIDKIQVAYGEVGKKNIIDDDKQTVNRKSTHKLYAVVSPVDDVASNLKSVLKAIDKAIDHIDELSKKTSDSLPEPPVGKGVYSSTPGQKKFTSEELDFLVRTFNKILNTSKEERKQLFSQFDKDEKSSER
ncbi:MAG: hypothetical protein KKD44_10585 [Proteobacteria bacterium]|nr:hypothetical protein [Pseudomonadota bacterium]